ncbi:MAG: ribulose-phosphate 3-epimerase [Clostridia bacterium]|nr:ribulose-phosphate 3-epimerase [Clostridia bacterium]
MANKLIRVSPSILAIDYNNDEILQKALTDIEKAGANMVHLDVMDGKFVKNKTFDHNLVDKIKDMTSLLLDVHLMIENADAVIDKYADAGADIITVHFEACKNIEETLKKIKAKNVVSGVAINPKTPALKLKDLLDTGLVDVVTVMSVQPGACGQKFIPGSAEKVAEIRELNKKVFIEIDGGVNTKNAPILRKLGANIIVSGSTIFSSKNIKKTIKQLKGKGLANRLRDYF